MQILSQLIPLEKIKADLLIVNTFAGETKPDGGTGAVDKKLKGAISKKIKAIHFTGKTTGEFFVLDNANSSGAKQIMVISLGDRKKFNLETVRKIAAISLLEAKKQNAKTVATILHGAGNGGLDVKDCAKSLTEGLLLADYHFDKYLTEGKKENQKKKISKVIICQKRKDNLIRIKQGITLGKISAQAQNFARDLVNEPPRHMYPKILAETAKTIAKNNKLITVQVLNKQQVTKLGMEAYLAVDDGSTQDLAFIHLIYKPTQTKKKIVLVGKSVTFDSGGLSLKPSDSMMTMKMDMAGGAAVLGLF
jgi:leucyl aminopeptidase